MSGAAEGAGMPAGAGATLLGLPRLGLLGLVALGALSQLLIQTQAYGGNPVVLVPSSDAAVLWERAGEIAGGAVVDHMPLDTAPLPLWMAALVRVLGGGLAAFGVVQSVLHVITAVLLAAAAAKLIRAAGLGEGSAPGKAGLLAGVLFLLLDEPAASTSRVLAGTLQLTAGAALLLAVSSGLRGVGPGRAAGIGALLGVLCLAFPPALAAIPLLAIGVLRSAGIGAAVSAAAASVLCIAPATAHNFAASGELIPISSQAGLTFYHGNNPSADGLIAPVGVVNEKATQARDALQRARQARGEMIGWAEADAYWRSRGLEWWASAPGDAIGVALAKLRYALTGRRYGDVYQPWRERDDGTASRLWLAPIPVAWIVPLALFALLGVARRRLSGDRVGALALFVAAPLAVCVVFFYSPRYRTPLIVGAVPLAALAAAELLAGRSGAGERSRRASLTTAAALGIGVLAGPLNRATGFDVDSTGSHEARHFERMAQASGQLGLHEDGRAYLNELLDRRPEDPLLRSRVARLDVLLLGNETRALQTLRAAPAGPREHPDVVTVEAMILATARDASLWDGTRALALSDGLIAAHGGAPALLDLRAMALARLGRFDEAVVVAAEAASMLTPDDPLRRSIEERLEEYRSGRPFQQPDPAQ